MSGKSKGDEALRLLDKLVSAMQRRGSEQDGNWGWPAFHDELNDIRLAIAEADQVDISTVVEALEGKK